VSLKTNRKLKKRSKLPLSNKFTSLSKNLIESDMVSIEPHSSYIEGKEETVATPSEAGQS